LKEINTFIQQRQIKLIKRDNEDIYKFHKRFSFQRNAVIHKRKMQQLKAAHQH